MTPIRTTDKQGIDGIILTGRPAGYWMAQSAVFPRIWTGAVADGRRAVRKHGTFAEVIEWLHRKAGIPRDTRADRVIRDSSDTFRGVRVTLGDTVRIPEQKMERAKAYTGFTCRIDRGKRGLRTPVHDGMRHGNALPDNPCRKERSDRDEEILRLSREGLIQREIAELLGISGKTVSSSVRRMRKNGVDVPHVADDRVTARRREKAEQFRRLQEGGMRVSEIARREGITPQAVYASIRKGKEAGG